MKRHEEGQGLVEYALILVLVAVSSIVLLTLYPDQVRRPFDRVVCSLGGENPCPGTGEPDSLVGEADIISGTTQTTPELDDVIENVLIAREAAMAQAEGLLEGIALDREASVEGFEVLIDKANDLDKLALSEALSQLVQDIKDGNLDAALDAAT